MARTITAVASSDPRGVVLVDVDNTTEAWEVCVWLRRKGHQPVLAPWRGVVAEALTVPVVGVVTCHPDALGLIKNRYPGALRVALVDKAEAATGADFVFVRPLLLDLVR